jgi:ABC-type antimicrobial peptide transport system permease subunit
VLAVAGLVLGMAGAAAATRVLGSLLFNVTPGDPSTLVIVGGLMLVVAAAACFVPAWRATRVTRWW